MTDTAKHSPQHPSPEPHLLGLLEKAAKDAATLGAGYIRVNANGSADLLDPAAVFFNPTPEPHAEPVAWYRDPYAWVYHFSFGPQRPSNNTSNPDEWTPLYALAAEGPTDAK